MIFSVFDTLVTSCINKPSVLVLNSVLDQANTVMLQQFHFCTPIKLTVYEATKSENHLFSSRYDN